MNWSFALTGIGLHLGALAWSLWLLRVYAHRWLIFLPAAILLSVVYAMAALMHASAPAWWQTAEFALMFYGMCLLVGGTGLHLGLVRYQQKVDSLGELVSVFQEFSESAPIGFFLYQDGRYVFGTDVAVQMTGYTREELVQMNYWDLATPATREIVRARGEARLAGQDVPNELHVPMVHKSGEVRWMHINVGTVMYHGKPAGLGTAFDITERKRTEEALRLSEERLRMAIHAARLAVWDWDATMNIISYTTVEHPTGEPVTFMHATVEEVLAPVPEVDRQAILTAVADARSTGGTFEHEHRVFTEKGETEWWVTSGQCYFDDAGALTRVIGIARNITARKHMEVTLRARTTELENISDHVPYQIIRFDPHHRLLYANRAALELAGLSHHNYVGRRVDELPFTHDLANIWRKHINDVFAIARPVEIEYDQRVNQGVVSFRALLVPETDEGQAVQSVMVICRDVTERKRLQKEVLEISAREQRRIGQDLHDGLGQLLTGIGFMVTGLQQEARDRMPIDDKELREISVLVEQAIGQTRQLAEGLDPVAVAMRGIRDGLQRLALQTEHIYGIPCSVSVDANLPALKDEIATQIYRIAQEAVNNAVKHADPSTIQIRLDRENDRLALRVTDDGRGFPSVTGSSGLGLRIMEYRANMIAGEFHIMSNPVGGSIITCRFDSTG